jgi:type IV pilus assembly protein PilN
MSPLSLEKVADFAPWKRKGKPPRDIGEMDEWPVLDLLREPRKEIGQRTIAAVLSERRRLLLQGTSIGAVLLGVVMGVSALVFLRHQLVKAQMGQLNEVESQAAALQQQLAGRNKEMAAITEINQQLSGALSNVRPTSALMADLRLRTPDGVQLLSADAGSGNLTIKGLASDPLAFARINALQLELRRSPLLDPQGISLSRLERKAETDEKSRRGPTPVQFEITAKFAPLDAGRLQQVLRELGSEGMARRLELMQREGLLP